MKIVNVIDLGNGILEAEFDNGQKAQYRKDDLPTEPDKPEHFLSEVRKAALDAGKASSKGGKKKDES